MVKAIGQRIDRPHRLQLLRLPEFDLQPCRGCYHCLFEGQCPIDDDFATAAEAILAADALILAVPTYFLGPNACLKRFTDRGLALYPHLDALWGKPAVAVGIAGIPGREGYTMLGLESALRLMFADIRAQAVVYAALPGEILLKAANLATAGELAAALFQPSSPPASPCCPLCGGTTFRFLDQTHIRCMLCSNAGRLAADANGFTVSITPGPQELFLTREDARTHREWLLGMKSRFQTHKGDLKEAVRAVRHEGEWIRPPVRSKKP
jgi:putative NADPH-quinone reductase